MVLDRSCKGKAKPQSDIKTGVQSITKKKEKLKDGNANRILQEQLCKSCIIREMGNDKAIRSEFISPIINLPKGNTIKLVIDARYLNSITDLSRYSWPLETIGTLLTKLKGNYFTTSDLCFAYNQVPLTEEIKQFVIPINTHFYVDSTVYADSLNSLVE